MQKVVLLIVLCFLFMPTAYAQDNNCSDTNSLDIDQVIDDAQVICQSRKGRKRRRRMNSYRSAAVQLKAAIGSANSSLLKNLFNRLRKSKCKIPDATPACSDATSHTAAEIQAALEAGPCTSEFQQNREDALKKIQRGLKKLRTILDPGFYDALAAMVAALKASQDCGQGGEASEAPPQCGKVVQYKNGDLWKPRSDVNGTPVFLVDQFRKPNSCIVRRKTGAKIVTLRNYGASNGRNSTWRSIAFRSCGSYPRNSFVSCQISGEGNVCWKVPNGCSRYE